ncbi:MAG: radical SAM protein [Candidatus Aenigmatarchaeota archaeon]
MLTYECNSKCKTCNIWKIYKRNPELKRNELSLEEFDKIFSSIGKNILWVNLGGGEPFLRKDLVEICESLYQHCTPVLTHILTNCILPHQTFRKLKKILTSSHFPYIKVNLSLDGIGEKHDEIRGKKGNFRNFLILFKKLKKLQLNFPNLKIGINTVISTHNFSYFEEIYQFISYLKPDSFNFEIAQNRYEFFNLNPSFHFSLKEYKYLVEKIKHKIYHDFFINSSTVSRFTHLFTLALHSTLSKGIKLNRGLTCYSGFSFCQIDPFGNLWFCGTLGQKLSAGNLREYDYNFRKIWFSTRAQELRNFMRKNRCSCNLANAFYNSVLPQLQVLLKILLSKY